MSQSENDPPTSDPTPDSKASAAGAGAGGAGEISEADLDALLAEINASESSATASDAPSAESPPLGGGESVGQSEIDQLLAEATFEDASEAASAGASNPEGSPIDLPELQRAISEASAASIDLLRDVNLNIKIELGRARLSVADVLRLGEGSVVELDKLAGDPVDVYVNERLVARGEVLVLNDQFCVRVNEIIAAATQGA